MSTAMQRATGSSSSSPANKPRNMKQLQRDRWTAAVVVAVMVGLFALIVWLASNGGVTYDNTDYWYMMP